MQLIAFHGDGQLKQKYLDRVAQHRAADELIRGTGWDGHKGCAVGCTLDKYDHSSYETELGIPSVIAHLEDAIFEGLPKDVAMLWPERFLSAIKPGADLSLISAQFMVWLLETELSKWETPVSKAVVALYRRRIAGDEPAPYEWEKAAWAEAAAWAAAWAAARAAARAAEAAAWAAARAAARAAEASYTRMADKLIELLEAA